MELRAGMYCVDAKGKRRGPIWVSLTGNISYPKSYGFFNKNGTSIGGRDPDLVAEWTDDLPYGHTLLPDGSTVDLTAIEKPLWLLSDDVREALKAHGGPYEMVSARSGWKAIDDDPSWCGHITYRVAPQPAPTPIDISGIKFADWVNWVAKDENGKLWAYQCEPVQRAASWSYTQGRVERLDAFAIDPGTCDWRNSLQRVKR